MKNIKTLIFCSIILIAACKKDGDSVNAEAALTTGKWQINDASIIIPGSSVSVDVFDSIPACIRDNFYTFVSGGTVTIDEGATKCDDSDPDSVSGSWQLLSNNTQLKTIDPLTGTNESLNILELNSSSLKVQDTASYMGYSVNATVTFKHIQ